jgi:iron complex transport system substrate-binding protein
MRTRKRILLAALAGAFACLAASCGRPEAFDDKAEPPDAATLRIVSLSPAISRTLVDLGLGDRIVGRTPYCESIDRRIPVVGDLLDLNWELLVRVKPTHVLVQPPASGIAPALVREAEARGWSVGAWRLDAVADIRKLLTNLPEVLLVDASSHESVAQRAHGLIERIDALLAAPDAGVFDGRTLLLVSLEPVTVCGEGTYLHELLIALGGRNAISMRGYPQLTLEDVARIDPAAIVHIQPGLARQASFGAVATLDVSAVRNGRLARLAHTDAFMPSSAVADVAVALRDILIAINGVEGQRNPGAGTP